MGYRVFFSRITLEGKLGFEYEPYIFAALNSAKVMIIVGTSVEHYNAAWVKNEWIRFLSIMKKERGRLLIPCYQNMNPYDLPDELSMLQAQDMGKIGFLQDLAHGVKKVLGGREKDGGVEESTLAKAAAAAVAQAQAKAEAATKAKVAKLQAEQMIIAEKANIKNFTKELKPLEQRKESLEKQELRRAKERETELRLIKHFEVEKERLNQQKKQLQENFDKNKMSKFDNMIAEFEHMLSKVKTNQLYAKYALAFLGIAVSIAVILNLSILLLIVVGITTIVALFIVGIKMESFVKGGIIDTDYVKEQLSKVNSEKNIEINRYNTEMSSLNKRIEIIDAESKRSSAARNSQSLKKDINELNKEVNAIKNNIAQAEKRIATYEKRLNYVADRENQ
jgi:predicted RNase H-like nuclease (RuvC/YqgF family)